MKDVVDTLKARKKELAVELARIDKALTALEPEKVAPRIVTPEHRKAISEGLKRKAAERKTQMARHLDPAQNEA